MFDFLWRGLEGGVDTDLLVILHVWTLWVYGAFVVLSFEMLAGECLFYAFFGSRLKGDVFREHSPHWPKVRPISPRVSKGVKSSDLILQSPQ